MMLDLKYSEINLIDWDGKSWSIFIKFKNLCKKNKKNIPFFVCLCYNRKDKLKKG